MFEVKQIIVAIPSKGRVVFDDTGKCVVGDRKWMLDAPHKVAVRGVNGESIYANFDSAGKLIGGSELVKSYLDALKPSPPKAVPDLSAPTPVEEEPTPVAKPAPKKTKAKKAPKKSDD